jgi:putative endonuclease
MIMNKIVGATRRVAPTTQIGRWAETIAACFLITGGFKILARNFNTRFGELDIVCQEARGGQPAAPAITFVEVRFRSKGSLLLPEESITNKKQRRIKLAASIYLNKFGLADAFVRFDVICVSKDKWFMPAKVRHIVDAF